MSFTEKIDVLDLLVNVLREHEEKLDEIVERFEKLEGLVERFEKAVDRCPAAKDAPLEDWL